MLTEVSLGQDAHRMLTEALTSVFTPESLRWFLRIRLHQSLDALVPGEQKDFEDSISQLVSVLEERGLLLELVARCREVAPWDLRLLRAAEMVGLDTPLTGALDEIVAQVDAEGLDLEHWLRLLGEAEGQVCTIHGGEEVVGAGFLVAADLVLTAESVLDRIGHAKAHCRFDAKWNHDGELVTPGIWYAVHEVVASRNDRDAGDGWALLRAGGSPGVQPIGGDAVESSTGTLRGWFDLSQSRSEPPPDRLLALSPGSRGSAQLFRSRSRPAPEHSGDFLTLDLHGSDVRVGAPVYSRGLAQVGLLCGVDDTGPETTGLVITHDAVLADLTRQGLDHLVRTVLR